MSDVTKTLVNCGHTLWSRHR